MNLIRHRLWLCWLCLAGCVAATAQAAEHVVLYGDENYRPYSFVENGVFKGIYVDILSKAAERLKPEYVIDLQPVPWKRGLLYLERGTGFALFPPGLKKERGYIQPYSVPLYSETVVVFCSDRVMKSNPQQFPADFAELVIGINNGFLLSERLMQAAQRGIVKLEEAKDNDSNLKKLALGRIDCYASDRGAALYSAKLLRSTEEGFSLLLREAAVLSNEDTFIGYSVNANPPYKFDFISRMDAVLTEMKSSGEIDRIIGGYFH
jgi:polar amino acid transport system substrate-binding protein